MATEEKLRQAWFCTMGLPSDIVVEVDDMNFHLHKFPLMSKSRELHLHNHESHLRQTRVTVAGETATSMSAAVSTCEPPIASASHRCPVLLSSAVHVHAPLRKASITRLIR